MRFLFVTGAGGYLLRTHYDGYLQRTFITLRCKYCKYWRIFTDNTFKTYHTHCPNALWYFTKYYMHETAINSYTIIENWVILFKINFERFYIFLSYLATRPTLNGICSQNVIKICNSRDLCKLYAVMSFSRLNGP